MPNAQAAAILGAVSRLGVRTTDAPPPPATRRATADCRSIATTADPTGRARTGNWRERNCAEDLVQAAGTIEV